MHAALVGFGLGFLVALCKRRGLIFPASEIYGGIANTYDYGHYGVLLKQNVIAQWWKTRCTGEPSSGQLVTGSSVIFWSTSNRWPFSHRYS